MGLNLNHVILGACVGLIVLIALAHSAHAAECHDLIGCDSSDGGWDAMQKLDEIGNPQAAQPQASNAKIPELSRTKRWNQPAYGFENGTNNPSSSSATEKSTETASKNTPVETSKSQNENSALQRSDESERMLIPIEEVSDTDVLLDVSENSTSHIKGSIVIPYTEFMLDTQTGSLKSVDDAARILGDAGISRDDSVVIYGECLPCGGGPSLATYVYWIMKCLGHENVRVLDGNVDDWKAAGRPTTNEAQIRQAKEYVPEFNDGAIATYDYVKSGMMSGKVQILDARTPAEWGSDNILGSINVPYDNVLDGKKIKSEAALKKTFSILDKNRPVVVYTNTGVKASVVWFSLEMMGYDAKLYSFANWVMNQPPQGNTTA